MDGVTNLNLGNNSGGLVSVNPDALEEVKVLTSNYQAEYGRSGGGFIALTTRGGTSELRGGVRYFRRHDSLNANTFFNNARGGSDTGFPRPLYRFNYYGWDLGGPVPFVGTKADPKLFFFAQEYYDQLVPQTASVNIRVPTAAEKAGDFSQSVDGAGRPIVIRDPLTGQPFPGNIIPGGPHLRARAAPFSTCSRSRTPPRAATSTTTPPRFRASTRAGKTSPASTGRSGR